MVTYATGWPPKNGRPQRTLPRSVTVEDENPTDELADRMRAARLEAFLDNAIPPTDKGDDLEALIVKAASFYAQAISDNTRKTYVRRWRMFLSFCEARELEALPATPETVMLYLADAVDGAEGAALSTLRGWLAAINRVHVEAGFHAPGDDPAMTMFLRALSRLVPARARVEKISALRIEDLRAVCRNLDTAQVDPVELRDRALLALRRVGVGDGEMARLRWADIEFTSHGVSLLIRAPRPDRKDRVVRIKSRRDTAACGVEALKAWQENAETTIESVFTYVDGYGRRESREWGSRDIRRIRISRLDSLAPDLEKATLDKAISLLGSVPPLVLRDKAMLLFGFAGAFRRTDLVGFRWSDLTFTNDGIIARLRRSKTDLDGHGTDVGIPRGASTLTCPVLAMEKWRARCEHQLGADALRNMPCFTHVGRAGRIGEAAISPEALTMMVQRRVADVTTRGRWGGRSLRAGFITTAADKGIRLEDIARQSRHATLDSLILYIRNDDPFRNNSADQVGL